MSAKMTSEIGMSIDGLVTQPRLIFGGSENLWEDFEQPVICLAEHPSLIPGHHKGSLYMHILLYG